MKPLTMKEWDDFFYWNISEWDKKYNKESLNKIKQAIQSSDNCQELLKELNKRYNEIPTIEKNRIKSLMLEDFIEDLKEAIGVKNEIDQI